VVVLFDMAVIFFLRHRGCNSNMHVRRDAHGRQKCAVMALCRQKVAITLPAIFGVNKPTSERRPKPQPSRVSRVASGLALHSLFEDTTPFFAAVVLLLVISLIYTLQWANAKYSTSIFPRILIHRSCHEARNPKMEWSRCA